ncbi:hypothetical protein FOZ60_000942 [Perkinsus olseni]|uniref:Uncharacterized protein n=1 Tax=Perkinsus olseni TaxID=32597 RepID=A0A7J6P193_PEROL|nr:hypothetical protein FOZ60_000942 [Perkinsus olseni]
MSYHDLVLSRFMHLSPIKGWEGAPLYRPEVLFATTTESTYLLLPWRGAVEIKPEPIDWTIVNGVKFAPLEFQYIQSHLYMNSVREAGVFRCVAGDTTYYEVELDYNAESLFRSVTRPHYAFNAEGRMSPSRREFDLGTEDEILEDLRSIGEFDIARSKPHQLPKAGSAYVGRQGSFRIALVFDERSTVAFASLEGATDEIRYVRYYAVGPDSGALITVAYTIGGQAHFPHAPRV